MEGESRLVQPVLWATALSPGDPGGRVCLSAFASVQSRLIPRKLEAKLMRIEMVSPTVLLSDMPPEILSVVAYNLLLLDTKGKDRATAWARC